MQKHQIKRKNLSEIKLLDASIINDISFTAGDVKLAYDKYKIKDISPLTFQPEEEMAGKSYK